MGKLVQGIWHKGSIITSNKKGAYDRLPRTFRDTISRDHPRFQPQSGRYHLYVSYACPWAHRALIYRELKDLQQHISVSVVHPDLLENGWEFQRSFPGATGDDLYQKQYLYEIYQMADAQVTTSVTVPVLWDKKECTIVNNESSEIIRIFNSAFDDLTKNDLDFYPKPLRDDIDEMNDFIYSSINNGVYKAGFAKVQSAYDEAIENLFSSLEKIEKLLANEDYLIGGQLTEADIRLLPTLLRFDCVYVTHFKCNVKRIKDFPALSRYLKRCYQLEPIKRTTNFEHIKRHYYYSHQSINPYRIIPKGPRELF